MAFPWPPVVLIDGPDTVAGVSPELLREEGGVFSVRWFEAQHSRVRMVRFIDVDEDDRFEFVDVDGNRYVLRELTLPLYMQHVRQKTVGGPMFKTQAEMVRSMRREW